MRTGSKKKTTITDDLLEMALHGYEHSLEAIEQKISEIKKVIGGGSRAIAVAVETYTTAKPKKRILSARARAAISRAQKKRWNEARKVAKTAVKKVKTTAKKTVKAVKAKTADVVPF